MKKVFSVDFQLYKVTGVEKVMLDIHHAVKDDYEAKIVGNVPYEKVHKGNEIKQEEYIKLNNPFLCRKEINRLNIYDTLLNVN